MSSDKKLCIATGIFPPDKGGPAQFVSSFSAWLTSMGSASTVISLTDGNDSHTKSEFLEIHLISRTKNLPIRMLQTSLLLRKQAKHSRLLINGLFLETLLATFTRKIDYVAKVPGDIVWERARNTGRTTLEIDDFQGREPFRFLLMRWAFTKSLKRARLIISPSKHLSNLITNWGIDASKVVVIPNSVNSEIFRPNPQIKRTYDLITVSRLVEWKGIKELIEIARLIPCKLLIVGSGPQEKELRELVTNHRVEAIFAGEIDQAQLPDLINSSKCFILNSRYEGSPHSLIEAMSCGAFVVARSNTGTEELIASGMDGILISEDDNLSELLRFYLKEPELISDFGEKARQKVLKEFRREDIFRKIYSILMEPE